MHACEKHNTRNLFYSLCALHFSCACTVYVALHMTAWKPTFKSVFSMLTVAALFRRLVHVGLHQPTIAKFLFDDR